MKPSGGEAHASPSWTREQIAAALGEPAARLIATIAEHAQKNGITLYLTGGVVRDLTLGRNNADLDFVLESDAIAFAGELARRYGGFTEAHKAFGTAKWKLDRAAIANLCLDSGKLPAQIDFATARRERYAAPAALPSVQPGTILQDMLRRDFTINALALRIEAGTQPWPTLDPTNGRRDIIGKRIRILHARSFIDDPTRLFRAIRFAQRLAFSIETDSAALMPAALPLIQRLSGERIRHELDLILQEAYPERMLAALSALGVLAQIHDSLRIGKRTEEVFSHLRQHTSDAPGQRAERARLGWHLLFTQVAPADAPHITARLNLTQELSNSILGYTRLLAKIACIGASACKASAIARFLDGIAEPAIRAALLCVAEDRSVKERLGTYRTDWRQRRSTIDGNMLKRAGLQPGPVYREILDKLRDAWIDGDIVSQQQERALLQKLVQEANEQKVANEPNVANEL